MAAEVSGWRVLGDLYVFVARYSCGFGRCSKPHVLHMGTSICCHEYCYERFKSKANGAQKRVSSKGWSIQQEKDLPGKESEPRNLDSRVAGDQNSEAYRQSLQKEDSECAGRNASERRGGPENSKPRRLSPRFRGESSMID